MAAGGGGDGDGADDGGNGALGSGGNAGAGTLTDGGATGLVHCVTCWCVVTLAQEKNKDVQKHTLVVSLW